MHKPQLKPVDSIVGSGGKRKVHDYLTYQFQNIGFEQDIDGLPVFAKFKGKINNKEIKVSFSIFKRSHYIGIDADSLLDCRTFKGVRMNITLPLTIKTRLIIAKKVGSKWLKLITSLVMKVKKFKCIANDYMGNEIYSPDIIYGQQIVEDKKVKEIINHLTKKQVDILSWGIIQIPNQIQFDSTFADLTDFDQGTLQNRLNNIVKLAELFDKKIPSKQLNITKLEILARDNPKALAWRALGYFLVFIVLGIGTLIVMLYFFAKLISMV